MIRSTTMTTYVKVSTSGENDINQRLFADDQVWISDATDNLQQHLRSLDQGRKTSITRASVEKTESGDRKRKTLRKYNNR